MAKKMEDVQNKDNSTESVTGVDLLTDPEAEALADYEDRTTAIIEDMQKKNNTWGLSRRGFQGLRLAMAGLSMTNGMYSRVPLVCKGQECPYAAQCPLLPYDRVEEGGFCLWEIAQIHYRAQRYAADIDYESASFTDRNLMSELIMLDVMLERCKALLAKDGTPVVDIAIGVDQEGNEVRQPAVSKAWEAYEKVSKKRDQTYQLLMLTRKDKKNSDKDDDAQNLTDTLRDVIEGTNISV